MNLFDEFNRRNEAYTNILPVWAYLLTLFIGLAIGIWAGYYIR